MLEVMRRHAACTGILWGVPLDMPCNIDIRHTVRICCRVRIIPGSFPMLHYIISRHRDFQIQYCFSIRATFFLKEQMFFNVLQLYEYMFCMSTISEKMPLETTRGETYYTILP